MKVVKIMEVIMLPKSNSSQNIPLHLGKDNKLRLNCSSYPALESTEQAQHLYVLSNANLAEGDWVYNSISGIGQVILNDKEQDDFIVKYINEVDQVSEDIKFVSKIEASTDTELNLPLVPQHFINSYCKSQGSIKNINVEMQSYLSDALQWQVKINSEKTIIILS